MLDIEKYFILIICLYICLATNIIITEFGWYSGWHMFPVLEVPSAYLGSETGYFDRGLP
jgi:hypothetical protein